MNYIPKIGEMVLFKGHSVDTWVPGKIIRIFAPEESYRHVHTLSIEVSAQDSNRISMYENDFSEGPPIIWGMNSGWDLEYFQPLIEGSASEEL